MTLQEMALVFYGWLGATWAAWWLASASTADLRVPDHFYHVSGPCGCVPAQRQWRFKLFPQQVVFDRYTGKADCHVRCEHCGDLLSGYIEAPLP